MLVTAYYVDHAPYSLTKTKKLGDAYDYKKINGDYFNAETNTNITLNHLDGDNYEVTFQTDYKAKGLLISENKMLVDSYSLEIRDGDVLLNGGRIKQVRYKRK